MSSLGDVLKAVREVIVVNERISQLSSSVEGLAAKVDDHNDRIIRVEAFIDLVRPAVTKRLTGPR